MRRGNSSRQTLERCYLACEPSFLGGDVLIADGRFLCCEMQYRQGAEHGPSCRPTKPASAAHQYDKRIVQQETWRLAPRVRRLTSYVVYIRKAYERVFRSLHESTEHRQITFILGKRRFSRASTRENKAARCHVRTCTSWLHHECNCTGARSYCHCSYICDPSFKCCNSPLESRLSRTHVFGAKMCKCV